MELGASSFSDLTDKVTHLIAVEPGSAKYKCALGNRIPIMHPSWITDSYEIWLRGDDVDVQESIESHRLPVFSGVVLAVSGIEDLEQRMDINRLVTENGGTKNEEMTDKMRYAEKFNKHGEANIHIIWEEWFWDSLDFGGRFDEETYKVSNPPPQRKLLPETGTPPPSSSPLNDVASLASADKSGSLDSLPVGDDDEEEIASGRHVPSEMLQIWGSLLKPRGFEVANGRLVHSPTKSQNTRARSTTREPSPLGSKVERMAARKPSSAGDPPPAPKSALSTFRRTNSFAPAAKDAPTARQLFKRPPPVGPSSSFMAYPSGVADVEMHRDGGDAAPVASSSTTGVRTAVRASNIFAGKTFRALGEAKGMSVKAAVEECGGRLVSEVADEDVDYIVVRLVSGSSFFQQETDPGERLKYRTECWLEQCIFDERICAPGEHLAFTPLSTPSPVSGAEHINLSYSGLDHSEACWIRRLARAIGANIAPNFSLRSTHLLCPSGSGPKVEKAREWSIPVVNMSWLADITRTGSIPPVQIRVREGVSIDDLIPAPLALERGGAMNVDPVKVDRKGKGKEKVSEPSVAGSTNSGQSDAGDSKHAEHGPAIDESHDSFTMSEGGMSEVPLRPVDTVPLEDVAGGDASR
ncbi:uncharacterized protein FIBRA_06849 [Fibroporia radiculosa]|uniref:BRCT domain-containing protein n=1 Tax=Fibroporia radiculosa TaxID=599839 RepID=J4H4A7_9APHY|nr:uncharacterized protein FIBRA_06849 [Fibroporia radiculosa]CCM04664.1 predicted protein [Fibroporia radiculosa]